MGERSILGLLAAFAFVFAANATATADDLKLKDGSNISGTIVGFDDSSFKVQTSYGFAMVKKDQVVSIAVGDTPKTAAEKKADPAPETKKDLASANGDAKPAPVAPATSVAAAAPPPPPEPIRENVNGNLYTNETYHFQMYKPPSWQVIAGAQTLLPGAIAAMGNLDQTTYLLIGKEPAGKALTGDIAATDQRLRGMLENFRPQGETQLNVSGTPAVEQRFRGSVDQKDWSGVVVFVPRGGQLYTIFGMTLADTDLVQIQENVIARTISSLQFAQ
jgi:hypothetical protein